MNLVNIFIKSSGFHFISIIITIYIYFGNAQTPTTSPTINALEDVPLSYDPLAQNWQHLSFGKKFIKN